MLILTTLVSNLKGLALKWPQESEKVQIINKVIMRIFNEYSKFCYKQHAFFLGVIFIPEMKWDGKKPHISHIQRRPE